MLFSRSFLRQPVKLVARQLSESVAQHNFVGAAAPLVQHFRSSWPDARSVSPVSRTPITVPPRTVPDECLNFEMKATFEKGTSVYYPHMKLNPADFKVILKVSINDCELNPRQKKILIEMVGPRYNTGKQEIKLVSDRFPNRIENKRHLILLLEKLIAESKRIDAVADDYQ